MPEDIVDAPDAGETVTPESTPSASSFDDIVKETMAELEETPDDTPETTENEPDEDAAGDDDEGEEDTSEDTPESDDEDTPEAEKPAEETPESDTPQEPSLAQELLALMRDKDLLNAALESAGVDTLQELPLFKQVIGRERQSASDQTRNEIIRELQHQQLVESTLDRGKQSADKFVERIDALAKAIEDGAEEFDIPDGESIRSTFEDYAQSKVAAYHNENFLPISEYLYGQPEMAAMTDEQRDFLEQYNGRPTSEWLSAHLDVMRNNLWSMAQNAVAMRAQEIIDNDVKTREAAHKLEVEKLTAKHERQLKAEVEKAKDAARAEALAEIAKAGPPRVPNKDSSPSTIDDDEITGDDFDSIAQSVFKATRKSGGGV